jgi:hypothetical protein
LREDGGISISVAGEMRRPWMPAPFLTSAE